MSQKTDELFTLKNHEPFLSSSHTSWSSSLKLTTRKINLIRLKLCYPSVYYIFKKFSCHSYIWRSTLQLHCTIQKFYFWRKKIYLRPICIINEIYKLNKGLPLQSRTWYMNKSNREFITFTYNWTVPVSFKNYLLQAQWHPKSSGFSTTGHVKVDGDLLAQNLKSTFLWSLNIHAMPQNDR